MQYDRLLHNDVLMCENESELRDYMHQKVLTCIYRVVTVHPNLRICEGTSQSTAMLSGGYVTVCGIPLIPGSGRYVG